MSHTLVDPTPAQQTSPRWTSDPSTFTPHAPLHATRAGLRRRPRVVLALAATGALVVGLVGGVGLGRATAPDPFARTVEVRQGLASDGTGASAAAPSAEGAAPATGDLTTSIRPGGTSPSVHLTAGLVTGALGSREPLSA